MSKNLILESFLLFSIPPSVFLRHHNKYFLLYPTLFLLTFSIFLPQQPFFSHHAIHLFPSQTPSFPIYHLPPFQHKILPLSPNNQMLSTPLYSLLLPKPKAPSHRLIPFALQSSAIITQKY